MVSNAAHAKILGIPGSIERDEGETEDEFIERLEEIRRAGATRSETNKSTDAGTCYSK